MVPAVRQCELQFIHSDNTTAQPLFLLYERVIFKKNSQKPRLYWKQIYFFCLQLKDSRRKTRVRKIIGEKVQNESETFSAGDSPHLPSRYWGREGWQGCRQDRRWGGLLPVPAAAPVPSSHGSLLAWDRRCPDPSSGAQTPQQWLFHVTT